LLAVAAVCLYYALFNITHGPTLLLVVVTLGAVVWVLKQE
jgi:hypothetical protein